MPGHAAQKGLTLCKNSIFRSPIHQVFHRIIVGELWQDLYIMTIKTRIYRKISCFWRKDMVCWNSTGLLRNTWEEWASENVKNSEIRLQSETAVFLYMFRCPEGHRFIFYQAGNGCMGNMTACIWRKQAGREMFYGYKNCSDRHYCGRPFQKRGTESAAPWIWRI